MASSPTVVLMCERDEPIDSVGLASWIAHSMHLAGLIVLRDSMARRRRALRAERRRTGLAGLADAFAFRAYYALRSARRDRAWTTETLDAIRRRYPADLRSTPRLDTADPNGPDVETFLAALAPDLMIARCKRLLARRVFDLPTHGTFVLHPGICPEYRNAHGCFWAMATRDLAHVGMTLLRIDAGVDTGRVFLHASCDFDEARESHVVIQHRVVLENLDAIHATLAGVVAGRQTPIDTTGRRSAVWGQPRLSAYWKWKRAVRRDRHASARFAALS